MMVVILVMKLKVVAELLAVVAVVVLVTVVVLEVVVEHFRVKRSPNACPVLSSAQGCWVATNTRPGLWLLLFQFRFFFP